jgi:hypothetical protein
MTALHTLSILSTSFTSNAFPTVLNEFPHLLITLLAAFPSLCGLTHPKPFQCNTFLLLLTTWLNSNVLTFLTMSNVTNLILKCPSSSIHRNAHSEGMSAWWMLSCWASLWCMFGCKVDISWTTAAGNPQTIYFLILWGGVDWNGPWKGDIIDSQVVNCILL